MMLSARSAAYTMFTPEAPPDFNRKKKRAAKLIQQGFNLFYAGDIDGAAEKIKQADAIFRNYNKS